MRVAVIASAPRGGLLHYAAQMSRALADRGHEVDLITARGHELDGPLGRARIRPALPASLRTPSEPPTGVRYLWRRALIAARVVAASARTLWEVGRGGYDPVLLTDDLSVVPAATGALVLTRMPGPRKVAAICHEPLPRSRSGDGVYLELATAAGRAAPPLSAARRRLRPRRGEPEAIQRLLAAEPRSGDPTWKRGAARGRGPAPERRGADPVLRRVAACERHLECSPPRSTGWSNVGPGHG